MAALHRALLAGDSATATLERWCGTPIAAILLAGSAIPPDAATRAALGGAPHRFRQVRLQAGDTVLSEAENWYLPGRLTAGMNAALEGTDAPFGRVVAPLGCRRETIAATVLADDGPVVLEHRAVLFERSGRPVCVVVERYLRALVEEVGRCPTPRQELVPGPDRPGGSL